MRNKIMKRALLTALMVMLCSCQVFALPPDPDNAALLYYQAFCSYEKPDDTMKDMIRDLARGDIAPNPTIIKYIENCRPAIKLAESAAELTRCDWGVIYSNGLDMEVAYLSQTRTLTFIILADARIALSQDNYDLAIKRCLTTRKLGIGVGQDLLAVGFLVEKSIKRMTNKCIQDILSSHAMEPQTLKRLREQLDKLDSRSKPLEVFLKTEREVMGMYATVDRIRELLPFVDPESEDHFITATDNTREYILSANADFCQENLVYYNKHWDAIFSAFELPYQQAYNRLKELDEKAAKDSKESSDAFIAMLLAPASWKIFSQGTHSETFSNAVKSAIELYIIKAKTGQLPDTLPAGMPKDLFSGKDFEYEKTAEGFILRCQGKDLEKDEIPEYEFKVKK